MTRHLLLIAACLAIAVPAAAQTTPKRIRGTIDRIEGTTLVIKTREGEEAKVKLASDTAVMAVVPATLADAKPGTYIGTAATGPKDKLRAVEVLIFPEAARGSGEGHYPWDLMPESTMTNATIESEVSGTDGRELTVKAKGETLKITVPANAPIVTFEQGSFSMLIPGAKVFIGAQQAADGTLSTARVNVGKDGLTPPM